MTSADAQWFWANHPGGIPWCDDYWHSGDEPHRRWAVEAVDRLRPANILELGCHCGPLLAQLAALPSVKRAVGIDVNALAVMVARQHGLLAFVGAVPTVLDRFPDRSVDVIVSSYLFAYLAPADLIEALRQCLRVANTGLVLVEPTSGPGVPPSHVKHDDGYAEWTHDYLDALTQAAAGCAARVDLTRTAHGPHNRINAVTEARLVWPN